jgi:hypothetical protein
MPTSSPPPHTGFGHRQAFDTWLCQSVRVIPGILLYFFLNLCSIFPDLGTFCSHLWPQEWNTITSPEDIATGECPTTTKLSIALKINIRLIQKLLLCPNKLRLRVLQVDFKLRYLLAATYFVLNFERLMLALLPDHTVHWIMRQGSFFDNFSDYLALVAGSAQ